MSVGQELKYEAHCVLAVRSLDLSLPKWLVSIIKFSGVKSNSVLSHINEDRSTKYTIVGDGIREVNFSRIIRKARARGLEVTTVSTSKASINKWELYRLDNGLYAINSPRGKVANINKGGHRLSPIVTDVNGVRIKVKGVEK